MLVVWTTKCYMKIGHFLICKFGALQDHLTSGMYAQEEIYNLCSTETCRLNGGTVGQQLSTYVACRSPRFNLQQLLSRAENDSCLKPYPTHYH